jgi:hypothetical protein
VGALALSGAEPANLVPDPKFANADFKPLAEKTTWLSHQIETPSSAEVDKGNESVAVTGGKTFLHCSVFDVKEGETYECSVQAKGKGKVSIECLWWARHGDDGIEMTKPHRTPVAEPVEVGDQAKTVSGKSQAPPGAKKMYIRIVVEAGTVSVSSPKVVPVVAGQ